LLFRERNNGRVAVAQQHGQYIYYDKQVAFLIDGSIEKWVGGRWWCHCCQTRAIQRSMLSAGRAIRRSGNLTPALKCRYSPRVRMIKLTMQRDITPYFWAHPGDDDLR
jgi:hypothetical protein